MKHKASGAFCVVAVVLATARFDLLQPQCARRTCRFKRNNLEAKKCATTLVTIAALQRHLLLEPIAQVLPISGQLPNLADLPTQRPTSSLNALGAAHLDLFSPTLHEVEAINHMLLCLPAAV